MIKKIVGDVGLLTVLLFLIGIPFASFPLLQLGGGSLEGSEVGAVLSGSSQRFGDHLEVRDSFTQVVLTKKIYFTAFFGQEAVYENLATLENKTAVEQHYFLAIVDLSGVNITEQNIAVYFGDQSLGSEVTLLSGESVPISLKVTAPPHSLEMARESFTLVVFEE